MSDWFKPQDGVRPIGRPLLALSDIHGDLEGLDSVLQATSGMELCGIIAAGDHCYDGPDPFGVWQRLLELKATLVRGETDLAIATLRPELITPKNQVEDERLRAFLKTREALGDIICRRLAELPSTAVVSLDHRAGVMVMHGSPKDELKSLTPDMSGFELEFETTCAAEDVLVVGRSHQGFVRRLEQLLLVGAGSVGKSPVRSARGRRTAHAVLIQEFSDGSVRAAGRDIEVQRRASSRARTRRRAG